MRLAVNIDHIATIREARKSDEPDPVAAAAICERTVATHLNIEMSASPEMVRIAQTIKPDQVTLVPERHDELTTEGGLDVVLHAGNVEKVVRQLVDGGIFVSVFVDPD